MQRKDYITLRVASLLVAPCLLKDGSQYTVHYTYKIFLLDVYLEEFGSEDVLECNDNYIIT